MAKALSNRYHIFALDLPEHGRSFHSDTTDLFTMNQCVSQWIDDRLLKDYILCGHSLGGKVAMAHACGPAHLMKALVVVDIAPRDYPAELHLPTLDSLLGLDLKTLRSRKHADEALKEKISNWAFRQFLLTNLDGEPGSWRWHANLSTLYQSMHQLSRSPLSNGDEYDGPVLFFRGGKSGYLRSEHFPLVMQSFPNAKMVTLPHAGHDVHVEDRSGFLMHLEEFLTGI